MKIIKIKSKSNARYSFVVDIFCLSLLTFGLLTSTRQAASISIVYRQICCSKRHYLTRPLQTILLHYSAPALHVKPSTYYRHPPLLVLACIPYPKYLKWIGYLVNLPHFQTFPIEEVPDTISSIISSEERWRDCVWNSNLPHKTIDWPLRWW